MLRSTASVKSATFPTRLNARYQRAPARSDSCEINAFHQATHRQKIAIVCVALASDSYHSKSSSWRRFCVDPAQPCTCFVDYKLISHHLNSSNSLSQTHSSFNYILRSAPPLFWTTDSLELGYQLHLFYNTFYTIIHHGCHSKHRRFGSSCRNL